MSADVYLIIAEKPKAAAKIAYALRFKKAGGKSGVPFWIGRLNGAKAYIAPAAGHLYSLKPRSPGYPVFEYEWAPRYEVERGAAYTRKFLTLISKLSKSATAYINACDYDIEGSVIGYLIIRFLGDEKRAYRVKFSSLTPEDLSAAFKKVSPLDTGMIEAGLCRHELDWIWGINVSRALMEIFKAVTGKRYVLSAGRVQSPTLMEALKRQNERSTFVPEIYFTLDVWVEVNGKKFKLTNEFAPPLTREDSIRIAKYLRRAGEAQVVSVKEEPKSLRPPPPFNLPDLQTEASRVLGLSPSQTLRIAEGLYLNSLISYPRTNSQRLPPSLNNRKIVEGLSRINVYQGYCRKILSMAELRPASGKKVDPAHPAIYPTGYTPNRKLSRREWRLYDLIVRRYLAAFGPAAKMSYTTYELRVGDYRFSLKGGFIVNPGWTEVYRFINLRQKEVPRLREGERISIASVKVVRKYSVPPPKYTKVTLLKWMESVDIGTEATRADILEVLFKRGYLKQGSNGVEVTELGSEVASLLGRFFNEIVSVNLTRSFEEKLEMVKAGKMARKEVVKEAVEYLRPRLEEVKDLIKKYRSEEATYLHEVLGRGIKGRKCAICGRLAEGSTDDGVPLCGLHLRAYRNVISRYSLWKERSGVGFCKYLRSIIKSSKTGKLAKEIASYLMREC
ncbi:MAG: DNA topoisomerase I [Desulfurococcales archaeon]|nr:DNA topoisomerase I [Desulfurococcales archaeon]